MASSMEVEEAVNNSCSPKRLGMIKKIQTNYSDGYIFQIVHSPDWESMAVSLSTNVVKIYSPLTGQYVGECNGHTNTINQISFSVQSSSHILHSCASDGTIRAWDTRSLRQVSCLSTGSSNEIFTFSIGSAADNLLASGSNSEISIWDRRKNNLIGCLQDFHTDDITQVHFVPNCRNTLLSASVDGLICTFDASGEINDNSLQSVINEGTSIAKVGFFGETHNKLWCLTHIESLSIWDWKDERNAMNFHNARQLASNSWELGPVDYFVDCHYPGYGENLWIVGGTSTGTLGYFPVNCKAETIDPPEAVLDAGHDAVVRTIMRMTGPLASAQSIFGWTGGEDGRLCCWQSVDSCKINKSWVSGSLAIRPTSTLKKHRHHPY